MPDSLTAVWNPEHGYALISATVTTASGAGELIHVKRRPAPTDLPAVDYTRTLAVGTHTLVDYLSPIGRTITYVLQRKAANGALTDLATAKVSVPSGTSYIRHLYYPSWGTRVRVTDVGTIRLPSRQTLYSISGRKFDGATYDLRGGREFDLTVLVIGTGERADIERIINDGNPISWGMCADKGEAAGTFAVGDVSIARVPERSDGVPRWLFTLPLTEVDLPIIYGGADQIADATQSYDQVKGRTYDALGAAYLSYAHMLAGVGG